VFPKEISDVTITGLHQDSIFRFMKTCFLIEAIQGDSRIKSDNSYEALSEKLWRMVVIYLWRYIVGETCTD